MVKRACCVACVLSLLVCGAVVAQTTKGAIRVEVTAEDGSLLPGATVVADSPEALGQRTAVADSSGVATLTGLDPSAQYAVTVSLDGFQSKRFENVRVKAGSTVTLSAGLPLAAVEEEIIVVAEAPTVDFTSAISGQDITLELTESLPTGRSYQSYLQLVPGVAPTDPSVADENPAVRSGLNYSDIGGDIGRSTDNFYYIEGIDVTDLYDGYAGADLNTEIIQEQSVLTGGIPAEYAGAPGLVSSVITKSGGNELHGSLNYYFQNKSLVADNKHADQADFSTYDTAFTLGGPLLRDELWFFTSFRKVHREEDVSALGSGEFLRSVETDADQGFGKLSWSPMGSIRLTGTYLTDPTDTSGQVLREVRNIRDRTEETGGDRFIASYTQVFGDLFLSLSAGQHEGELSRFAANQEVRNDVYFLRGDDFTSADEQRGGYGLNRVDERDNVFVNGKLEWFLGTGWGDHTLAFGAERMEHERTLYDRYPGGAQYSSIGERYAGISAAEYAVSSFTGSDWEYSNTSDYTGTIAAIDASPNAAMHYSILDTNGDGTISMEELGAALFNSTAGNPHGQVNYYRIVEQGTGAQEFSTRGTTLYLQDTFQTGRVSINAGIRAEQWKHYATNGENIFTFDWELAPRLGVIYDVTGEGRHKLSAYYGRYYDPIRLNMTSFAGTLTGRSRHEQIFLNGEWLTYRVRGGSDAAFSPTTETPYTDDIQVGYEVALGRNMSFEALYINRKTRNILEDYDLCLYATCEDGSNYYPGDINDPDTLWLGLDYFGYDENPGTNFVIGTLAGGKRDWEGVELVFRKRFSDNWQAIASYTWADAMGNSNSDSNADFQGDVVWLDPRSPNQWGRQPGMIEHIAKLSGSYHFDNGIVLGGSYRWNSGTVSSRTWAIYSRNLPVRVDEAYEWNGTEARWLREDAVGSLENDSWGSLDLRAQYKHTFGWLDTELFVDVFNVFDDQAAVRNQDLEAGTGAADFGEPIQWVPPRRYYLGVRLSF